MINGINGISTGIRAVQDRILEYTRRLGLGDLRAPDPLDADPDDPSFADSTGFKLPPNFAEVSNEAKTYESLTKHPGWSTLLHALELRADRALGNLRGCTSHDPLIVAGFAQQWRMAESHISVIEDVIDAKLQERDAMLADLAARYGADLSPDEVMSEVSQVSRMKNQLKKEGMVAVSHEEIYNMVNNKSNNGDNT